MTRRDINITEYQSCFFDRDDIDSASEALLYTRYRKQIEVTPPSYITQHRWKLTAKGYVGHIPLTRDLHLHLQPKVSVANIFGMWEYAYKLNSFQLLEGVTQCDNFQQFYSQLATILARHSLDLFRRGLYRTYLNQRDRLTVVRGKLDLRDTLKRPWEPRVTCDYPYLTADVPENQLVAWTLYLVVRSGLCDVSGNGSIVRKAYKTFSHHVTLQPFEAKDCMGRSYHRLNSDYQLLHSLCRFFLENTVPNTRSGDRLTFPFLVNMAQLYEKFVAEWLRLHVPKYNDNLRVESQKKHHLDDNEKFVYKIDLVIYDRHTHEVRYVLDTKYKVPQKPSSDDLAQIHSYARTQHCREAVLIYPEPLRYPYKNYIDRETRVRTLIFTIDGDLEKAGKVFLTQLF
ncbi:restriction endonuclease [Geitlerinema sp. CS-897]|nr:restriction endonuclease [Geitlerinema sp. CS-897]